MDNAQEISRAENSRLGLTSFALAVLAGLTFMSVVFWFSFAVIYGTFFIDGGLDDLDAPGIGVLIDLGIAGTSILNLIGLVFGIAGIIQRRRVKKFAIRATVLHTFMFLIVFAYIAFVWY